MIMEVFRLWGVRLPMIWLLQFLALWNRDGIWYAMIVSNFIVVLIGLFFYRQGKWKKRVLSEDMVRVQEEGE